MQTLPAAAGPRGAAALPLQARAFAPASVANVAVGFDLLGYAVDGVGDTVTVRRIDAPEVRIAAIRGTTVALPLEAARNDINAAPAVLRSASSGKATVVPRMAAMRTTGASMRRTVTVSPTPS
ncbi:MAG: hypothetical protein ABW002_03345, partial [Xanthomonas sp.]